MGGVLLTNGWDTRERAVVLDRFGLDRIAFEARHLEPYRAWERGAISLADYLQASVFNEPRNFSQDEFFAAICDGSQPLPDGALGILAELAASDKCMIGALNNEARETNEYRFEHFGLRRYFKLALTSCYLGLRKPDAAIYLRALDILGRSPARILFIDDREENTDAAEAVGIKAIHFTGEKNLRQALANLNVL